MVKCPQCGHHNLPSFPSCSRCGAALGPGGPAASSPIASPPPAAPGSPPARLGGPAAPPFAPTGTYQAVMDKQVALGRRNRAVYAAVVVLALGALGFVYLRDSRQKAAIGEKMAFFDRWAELETKEAGAFWACVMGGNIDVGHMTQAVQFQNKIEGAYATQPKTYAEQLLTECQPKLERAREAMGALGAAPAEFAGPLDAYKASLPKLGDGMEAYAEKLKGRQGNKDLDTLIQETGNAWHAGETTPAAIAYERFLTCAVPGHAKMKDAQAVLEFLADSCFKKDAVAYMERVRRDCGGILQAQDAKAPSKTWKGSRRFLEEEARQLAAWESCGKRARKGKKADDMEPFLLAIGDYMKARADVAMTARGLGGK